MVYLITRKFLGVNDEHYKEHYKERQHEKFE